MLFESNIPNYDGFGVIANSDFPVPEAFIIKNIANQNTFKNSFGMNKYKYNNDFYYSNYYNHNDNLEDEEDEEDEYNEYEEEEDDE